MKSTFKKSAHAPYRFDLAKAAEKAYAEFPELRSRLVFVDICKGQIIGAPDIKNNASYLMNTNRDLSQAARLYRDARSAGCYSTGGISFVLMYTAGDLNFLPGQDIEKQMNFVLHHELAHQLCPQARKNGALSESTADSYATLRHLSRYGNDHVFFNALLAKRAADVKRNAYDTDFEYFTCPSVRAAIKHGPVETAAEAVKTAGALAAVNQISKAAALRMAADIRQMYGIR